MHKGKAEIVSHSNQNKDTEQIKSVKNFHSNPADFQRCEPINERENCFEGLNSRSNNSSGLQTGTLSKNSQHEQVRIEILDMFLDIKRLILEDDDKELEILHKTIPLEADEEEISKLEPLVHLDFIRQSIFQIMRSKVNAQKHFEERKESECLEYEPHLQKLEAEIREHIKIEQQMKVYTDSLQDKIDEFEKNKRNNSRNEGASRDKCDELIDLRNKYTQQEKEIEGLKKDVKMKADQIQALELQADLVPILRAKVAELERIVQFNQKPRSSIVYDTNFHRESREMVLLLENTV